MTITRFVSAIYRTYVQLMHDICPARVQERRLARYNVSAIIEDDFVVKSYEHMVGTVYQDHDNSQATASASISHDSSIASASDSRKESGGEEHIAYQGIGKYVYFGKVRRSDQVGGTYGHGHGLGQ